MIFYTVFLFALILFFLGYDGHLIFENLAKLKLKKAPTVIAKSQEKFISIQLGPVEFKDSLQFLNSSLDKLVKNLKQEVEALLLEDQGRPEARCCQAQPSWSGRRRW